MRGVIPNYHHSYNLFFFVFVISIQLFCHAFSTYASTFSSNESLTISSNRTIVSLGDDFELGFFKAAASFGGSDRWYLGIWYKKIPARTFVWVANRDNPLSGPTGTLRIFGINFVLLNESNSSVWSTNLTGAVRSPVVAELLANGNFVLRDSKTKGEDGILWQSFDYPTDTLLPHMKLGLDLKTGHNRFFASWKTQYDPSCGDYLFKLSIRGIPEFFLWRERFINFRSCPWDGMRFSGIPEMVRWHSLDIVCNFTENKEEVAFSFRVTTPNIYRRLTITSQGYLQLFTWNPTKVEWTMQWIQTLDNCAPYASCTPYAYCDTKTSPVCNCIQGFEPRYPLDGPELGMNECARKMRLSCTGDGFVLLKNMKLPDTSMGVIADNRIGLMECEEGCLRDCNCTGFAEMDIQNGGSGCIMWTSKLADIRKYATDAAGQDLYVKVAAVDLG